MKTNNKLLAMLLLAAFLASGIIFVAESNETDADILWTDVSNESELNSVFSAGGNAKLAADITLSTMAVVPSGSTVILDLAGYEITYSGPNITTGIIMVRNGGDLTINDSSDDDTGRITGTSSSYAGVQVTEKGYWTDTSPDAILTINGGTIEGYYYGITGNGSRHNTDITMNGGTVTATNGTGIYNPQNGVLTVTGGIVTGTDAAIEIRAGELNIAGGTFTASATPTSVTPNGNGTTSTGAAIAQAQHTTKLPVKVTITGGTFYAYTAFYQSNPQNNPAESATLMTAEITGGSFITTNDGTVAIYSQNMTEFIKGGFFSSDPTQYVYPTYEAKLVSDIYCVGIKSDDGSITVDEVEEAEDGTTVSTESVIKTDDSGKVTSATVTIRTEFGSVATAKVNASGSATLTSDTKGAVYLSDAAFNDLVGLMQSASGSDRVSLNVATAGTSVSLGASATEAIADGSMNLSITVNRGSSAEATITLNSESLKAESTYVLSVESNPSMASALRSAGLTGTTPFDIELTSEGVIVNLDGSVTVSVPVDGKYDNMRMYCIDNGDSYAASYSAGSVTATIDHFSTWAIVYDKPVVVTEDDDDILFILEQQKKAQEAASSQTTTDDNSGEEAAVIIAAAAVAGAMLACAFFAFRRP